jgi:DNA polymerase-3 subunit beta
MLKINVKSFQEGIKELSKFKSKEYFINLVNENESVYLTKILISDFNEVITYKLDAELTESENYNFEVAESMIKAVNKLKENEIEIRPAAENNIELSTKKRKIDFIKGIHEFNTILFNFNVEEKFNISCDNFKILLQVTDYAAKDQTIPILQGVNFKQNKVCCLDGYRLALREFNDMDLEKSYTVQSSILSNLNSIVKKDSEIAIQFNERECNIKIGSLSVTSKLLEGKFINYEQIIPREFNIKAEVEQHELKEEIEFLLSLADDKNNQLLKFNMNNDKVTLLSKTTESSSDITLENATANGEIEIAFNTSFVYDMLKHFDNKIRFEIINSISPMICKCEEINGLDLILPMRIFK